MKLNALASTSSHFRNVRCTAFSSARPGSARSGQVQFGSARLAVWTRPYAYLKCWSQWSRGLRRRSTAARQLRMWVRIPASNTDTTPTQPHRNSNTHRTKNNTTNVVIQQNSRKLLMMDILMSETCWAHTKWNKIASDIKLVFYSSTITMMHGPINIKFIHRLLLEDFNEDTVTSMGQYSCSMSKIWKECADWGLLGVMYRIYCLNRNSTRRPVWPT